MQMSRVDRFGAFSRLHLACYAFSVLNLISYALHWVLYRDKEFARSIIGGIMELICVSVRFWNEWWHVRLTTGDVIHHGVLYFGAALCFFHEPCTQFSYLLTHMNILHVPMLLWYGAARRSNYAMANLTNKEAWRWQLRARAIFPAVFMLSSVYRVYLIITAALREYLLHDGHTVPFICLLVLGLPLAGLDYHWYGHFSRELKALSTVAFSAPKSS